MADRRPDAPRIAVVGAGFSGAAATAALLRAVKTPISILIVDDAGRASGGLAYGRASMGERLNVRAQNLSLLDGEQGDFADWLDARLSAMDRPSDVEARLVFALRSHFGDYIRERLTAEMARRPDARVEFIKARALSVGVAKGSIELLLSAGAPLTADALIVATGYGFFERARRFGANPFDPAAIASASAAGHIALVGSGLTAMDALLSLRKAGAKSSVSIISRRARLPMAHDEIPIEAEPWTGSGSVRVSALMREIRTGVSLAARDGHPWQAMVDGLRPNISTLWGRMPVDEQRRFLRHARAYWDAHRHRLAPEIAAEVRRETAGGHVRLKAARAATGASGGMTLAIRGEPGVRPFAADAVFDCSGWTADLANPLVASLVSRGLAARDPHGLGLKVEPDGRVAGVPPDPAIHAIGPLGQGSLLEITSAPEIAAQARGMAERLATELRQIAALPTAQAPARNGN